MKKENVLFLSLALVTVICIMAIGVAIAERSIFIAFLSLVGITATCGVAFSYKKKLRESRM